MKLREDIELCNSFGHFIDLREIDENSVIVDAGACHGDFVKSLQGYKQGKNCKIIAIECNKDNIRVLEEKNYPNITIYNKAFVGQNFGDKVVFTHIIGLKGQGNLFSFCHPSWKEGVKEYEVETLRVNDIFSVLNIEWIDFLKMDIEGSEWEILKTMTEETAAKVGQMSLEVHEWYGFTISAVVEKLNDLGFKTCRPDANSTEIYGKREYLIKQ